MSKRPFKLEKDEILVLRDSIDCESRGGFKYPEYGQVICEDWVANNKCGNGLHGLPWGEGGDYFIGKREKKQTFQLIKVKTTPGNYVHGEGDFKDKCKFKKGFVVLTTNSLEHCQNIIRLYKPKAKLFGAICTYDSPYDQIGGNRSLQESKLIHDQQAGSDSIQINGITQVAEENSLQFCAYSYGKQTAGPYSIQICHNNTTQIAGEGTLQIGIYYPIGVGNKTAISRLVSRSDAGKPYLFQDGEWTEVKTRSTRSI